MEHKNTLNIVAAISHYNMNKGENEPLMTAKELGSIVFPQLTESHAKSKISRINRGHNDAGKLSPAEIRHIAEVLKTDFNFLFQ